MVTTFRGQPGCFFRLPVKRSVLAVKSTMSSLIFSSHRIPQFSFAQGQSALKVCHRRPQPPCFFVANREGLLRLPEIHTEAVYHVGVISFLELLRDGVPNKDGWWVVSRQRSVQSTKLIYTANKGVHLLEEPYSSTLQLGFAALHFSQLTQKEINFDRV